MREFEKWHGWSGSDPFPRNCTTEAQRRHNCTTDFGSAGARTWADLQTVVDGNAGTSVNGLDVDKTPFLLCDYNRDGDSYRLVPWFVWP